MTNKEAVNWIINLSADIGKSEHSELWHYEQALYEIREMLESTQQWIPVSKRLPAFEGWYIVTVDVGDSHYFNPVVDWLYMENGKWHEFYGRFEEFSRPVIAWMRSPEPYMPEPYKQAKMAREDRDE